MSIYGWAICRYFSFSISKRRPKILRALPRDSEIHLVLKCRLEWKLVKVQRFCGSLLDILGVARPEADERHGD